MTSHADITKIAHAFALVFALVPGLMVTVPGHAEDWREVPVWRVDIAGRWVLRMSSGAYCVLGLSGAPEGDRGTVAANGFCPPLFLARPRWWFDAGRVVMTNRRGDVVADLALVGRNYLKGQIATGELVSLTR
jgi:protease inhibitor Inh